MTGNSQLLLRSMVKKTKKEYYTDYSALGKMTMHVILFIIILIKKFPGKISACPK